MCNPFQSPAQKNVHHTCPFLRMTGVSINNKRASPRAARLYYGALPAMNATNCQPDLEGYVLDALSPEERAVVEAHVRSCAACRVQLARLDALAGMLRGGSEGGGGAVPPVLRRRLHQEIWLTRMRERVWLRQSVWLRVAALLVGVLGLGYIGLSARQARRGAAGAGATWTQTGICAYPGANGSYPVVSGRMVVAVENKDGRPVLVGMDRNTGLRVWESAFAVMGVPSSDGKRVYVWRVSKNNQFCLAALDMVNGREVWTAAGAALTARQPWPTVAALDGVAWCGDSQVALLDGATGIVRWTHPISDEGALSVPAVNSNCLYVASSRTVQALDLADGRVLWHGDESPSLLPSVPPLVQCDGRLVVVVRNIHAGDGMASCRDAATGAPCWSRQTEMPWHVAVADGRVFLRGTQIRALDGRTGNAIWSVAMGGCSPIEVYGGCVYSVEGVDRKGIFALSADTGKQVWRQRMLSSCSGLSVAGRMGYLSTQDGLLRAVVIRRRGS